jgi:hypothetical protein
VPKIAREIFFLCLFASLGFATVTTTLVANSEAYQNSDLMATIHLTTSSNDTISNLPCTVFVTDDQNATLFWASYDSILNEPPSMKTNSGGYAYIKIPITHNFIIYTNNTMTADCDGNRASLLFHVYPTARSNDVIAGWVMDAQNNSSAIIIYIIGGLIALAIVGMGVQRLKTGRI